MFSSKVEINSILHINTNDLRGGAAKVAWRLSKAQRDRGYTSNMLVGFKESSSRYTYPYSLNKNFSLSDACREQGMLYYDLMGSHHLVDNLLVKQADILHLHNLHGDVFNPFSLSSLSHFKPTVWTLHDMQPITGHCAYSFSCNRWEMGCGQCPDLQTYPAVSIDSTSQLWKDKRNIYHHSNLQIVTPSNWLKKIVEKGILRDHPIELIYNGVDTRTFYPRNKEYLREKYAISKNAIIIGCVANGGSFGDRRKGGYYIKEAMDFLKERDIDFIFMNIGANQAFDHDPNIINTGYVTDEGELGELYSLFDVFLFPSLADNCPLVVSEAMACGTPIVTFHTGGIPELVQHGKNGLVADYQDTKMLLHCLEQLTSSTELRDQFSHAARKEAVEKYDHNLIVAQYEKLYERCLNSFHSSSIKPTRKFFSLPRRPKVLVLYVPENDNFQISDTYQSILNQTYPNVEIQHGLDNINRSDADLIYYVKEGIVLDPLFFEMMLYNYHQEDAICCNLKVIRRDGTIFYREVVPETGISKMSGSMYDMNKHYLFLYNKKYFLEASEANVVKLNAGWVSATLEWYVLRLLGDDPNGKIFVYGAGTHTEDLLDNVDLSKVPICGVIDKNASLQGSAIHGYPIFHVTEMEQLKIDKILISSATYEDEIYNELSSSMENVQLIRIYGYGLM